MAIYQPTNITPSSFGGLGNGVVSATDTVKLSWQVNGNSPMTAFSFAIARNDSTSSQIYNSPVIVLDSPFWGTDSRGNPQFFTYTDNRTWESLDAGTSPGIQNGNSYKLTITQYWGTNNENSVTQYSPSVFVTRTAPTLTLDGFGEEGYIDADSPSVTVTATYNQAEGEAINWCRWIYYSDEGRDVESVDELTVIEDTGEIYTGDLSYVCDGMIKGYGYGIQCMVQTQSGMIVSTPIGAIVPDYQVQDQTIAFSAIISDDSSALIDISASSNLIGAPTPSQGYGTFQNGYLNINNGASVVWNQSSSGANMNLATPWYLTWSGVLNAETTNIFRISDQNEDSVTISFENGSSIRASFTNPLVDVIIDFERSITGYNCLITFSPNFLGCEVRTEYAIYQRGVEVPAAYTQTAISSITLYELTQSRYIQVTSDSPAYGVFGNQTLFLTQFNNSSLDAISAKSSVPNGILYRFNNNSLSRLYFDSTFLQIRDFGVRSGESYYYELIATSGGNTYSNTVVSNTVCKQFSAYYLIEATEDPNTPNLYHALNVWKFGNNIESGSISNNNTPSWLTNFTPYRLRQPISRMGKSGTLQALLSNYDPESNRYRDSSKMMDDLWDASISNHVFFLKDMKGNLYMVHISAPITQTINIKSRVQQVTVSIPWEEIGDASKAVIIQLPTDPGWKENMVSQVSLNVDADTGVLTAVYPESYYGSTFRMQSSDLIMMTRNDVPTGDIVLSEISDGAVVLHLLD